VFFVCITTDSAYKTTIYRAPTFWVPQTPIILVVYAAGLNTSSYSQLTTSARTACKIIRQRSEILGGELQSVPSCCVSVYSLYATERVDRFGVGLSHRISWICGSVWNVGCRSVWSAREGRLNCRDAKLMPVCVRARVSISLEAESLATLSYHMR